MALSLILVCIVLPISYPCAAVIFPTDFPVLPRHCGYSTIHPDLLGDYNASLGSWPWVALLYYQNDAGDMFEGCAGSLIADQYIVTGAHCVQKQKLNVTKLMKIRLGEHNVKSLVDEEIIERGPSSTRYSLSADVPQDFTPDSIIIHPDFKRTRQGLLVNDIALIKLDKSANITTWVRPICLPEEPLTYSAGKRVYLAGWGKPDYYSDRSTILRHIRLPLLSTPDCVDAFSSAFNTIVELDKNSHICAGGEAGKDACDGDGGGPLMEQQPDGRWVLIGTVSFGRKVCGAKGVPSIYSNVMTYCPWIEETIRKDKLQREPRRESGRTSMKLREQLPTETTTQNVQAETEVPALQYKEKEPVAML